LVIAGLNRDENVVFLPHITFTLNESEAFPGLEVTSISHHDGICNDCKRKNKSVTGSLRFSNTENLAKNFTRKIYEINLRISSLRMDYIESKLMPSPHERHL
jgi:hypothetical protein